MQVLTSYGGRNYSSFSIFNTLTKMLKLAFHFYPSGSAGQEDEKSPTTSSGEQGGGESKDHTDGALISRPKEVEQVEDMKLLQGILKVLFS